MGNVNAQKLAKGSAPFFLTSTYVRIPAITSASAAAVMASATLPASPGAVTVTGGAPLYNRVPTSVVYTPNLAGGASNIATIRVTGQDQFGGTVTEDISLSGTTAVQGSRPLMRIDSITVLSIGDPSTRTLTIGYGAGLTNLKVALPTKNPPAGLIKFVTTDAVAIANPVAYTVNVAGSFLTISTALTGVGEVYIWYDPQASAWA